MWIVFVASVIFLFTSIRISVTVTLFVYPGKVTETLYQSMSRNSTGQMQAMIVFFLMNKLPDKTHIGHIKFSCIKV